MFTERTSVGLDVYSRSVAAAAIDGMTGELFQARLTPDFGPLPTLIWEGPLSLYMAIFCQRLIASVSAGDADEECPGSDFSDLAGVGL